MPEIKGDYQGKLKTIKATAGAKLETVSAIDAGTNVIGNIDRVATVGDINHLGSIGNVAFDQGAVSEHRRDMWAQMAGSFSPVEQGIGGPYVDPQMHYLTYVAGFQCTFWEELIVAPGNDGLVALPLLTDDAGRLKLATLGTVERVKDIDNVGTVGRLETLGMIEAGTISEVTHVGTIGDITHLGSIGNVNRIDDLGSVDSRMHAQTFVGGVWTKLYQQDNGLITSPGKCAAGHYPLAVNAAGELKTAPATSRKGGVQTVNNAGTAVALIGTHTACIGVIVQADYENLGTIYVGDSTVDDTHGFKLRRDKFISFSADDVNDVYIDASRGTQSVSFLYINY